MKTREDLTGRRYGYWTVLRVAESAPNGCSRWLCRCDCGNEKMVLTQSLKRGRSTSCGCGISGHTLFSDITGKRFGKLVAIKPVGTKGKSKTIHWLCRCDCGTIKTVDGNSLRRGKQVSCGCVAHERFKHIDRTKIGGNNASVY